MFKQLQKERKQQQYQKRKRDKQQTVQRRRAIAVKEFYRRQELPERYDDAFEKTAFWCWRPVLEYRAYRQDHCNNTVIAYNPMRLSVVMTSVCQCNGCYGPCTWECTEPASWSHCQKCELEQQWSLSKMCEFSRQGSYPAGYKDGDDWIDYKYDGDWVLLKIFQCFMIHGWPQRKTVITKKFMTSIVRIQAVFRGYLFRHRILYSPHTDIGRRFLLKQFEKYD